MKKCCTLQVKQTWFKTGLFMKLSTNNLLLGKAEKSDCPVWWYSVKLGAGVLGTGTLKPLLYTRLLHNKLF